LLKYCKCNRQIGASWPRRQLRAAGSATPAKSRKLAILSRVLRLERKLKGNRLLTVPAHPGCFEGKKDDAQEVINAARRLTVF